MPALKACFEAERLRDVATYIQSGNVLFAADRSSQQALTARIERALSRTFACESRVVVRSFEQMRTVVQRAPRGFGEQPEIHRYDVIFLKHPLTVDEALQSVTARPRSRWRFRRRRCAVFLAPHRQSHAEPTQSHRRQAGLSEHDHP